MLTITIDTYDSTILTSLTEGEMGERYDAAVQAAYPDARVRLVRNGRGTHVQDDDWTREQNVLEHVRQIIEAEWQRATEEHPYEEADDEASDDE